MKNFRHTPGLVGIETIGKTVKGFAYSSDVGVAISFTDDTVIAVCLSTDEDGEMYQLIPGLPLRNAYEQTLFNLKLITEAERDQMRADREAKAADSRVKVDRLQWDDLVKKYGTDGPPRT